MGDRQEPEDPKETQKWETEKQTDENKPKFKQAEEDAKETKIWEAEKVEPRPADDE